MTTIHGETQEDPAGMRPLATDELDAVNGGFGALFVLGVIATGVVIGAIIVNNNRNRNS
jgi:hypothetical protein